MGVQTNILIQDGGNARGLLARFNQDSRADIGPRANPGSLRNRPRVTNSITGLKVLERASELKALLDGGTLSFEEVALTRIMPRRQPLRLTENAERRDMFAAFLSAGKPMAPIVVRRVGDGSDKMEVVDGEDRREGARRAQKLTIRVMVVDCSAEVGFALAGLLNTRHGTPLNDAEKLAFAIALLQGNRDLRQTSDRDLERAYNLQISDSTFLRAKQAIRKRKKKIPTKVDAKTTAKPKAVAETSTPDELPKPTRPLNAVATECTTSSRQKVEPAALVMSDEERKHLARALYRATADYATRFNMPRTNVYLQVCQVLGEEV